MFHSSSPFSAVSVLSARLQLRRYTIAPLLMMSMIGSILIACGGDTTGTAPAVTDATYVALVLNQHAINMSVMAPSNTIQLVATAFNTAGAAVPEISQMATFRATDSSVTVSASGLVTAQYVTRPGDGTQVIATLQHGNVTYTDTAYIQVTATGPGVGLQTFSIQPMSGDSAVGAVGALFTPTVTAMDSLGHPVGFIQSIATSGIGDIYWLNTSNQITANYLRQPGRAYISLNDTGHVTLYATSWVYGVAVEDSLKYLIGWPLSHQIIISANNSPFGQSPIFLGVGGVFRWAQVSSDSVGIVFDDSLAVDSATFPGADGYTGRGNMYFSPFDGDNLVIQARSFPVAGTYRYHSQFDTTKATTIFVLNNPVR